MYYITTIKLTCLAILNNVTTCEEKEDKLPVLVFGTEQVDL